jgi:pyruvyl transferase EpsO
MAQGADYLSASSAVAGFVDALGRRIDAALSGLLAPRSPVAHVGYPNHWNTGDPAIWLGEQAALERLGCPVVYQCGWQDYDRGLLARCIGDGPILIAGGGNLGDLWPNHQVFRERIIADFPANPIIQLPQSLCFGRADNLVHFRRLCAVHSRLTLMLRDRKSYELACALFDAPALLTPDMAFALGPQIPPDPDADRVVPVFWLSRTDKESAISQHKDPGSGCERRDWLEPGEGDQLPWLEARRLMRDVNRGRAMLSKGMDPDAALRTIATAYGALARLRLRRGLRMLSRGRVVVTDRLHGHILSLCLGRPQVLLDNSNGKVSATYDAWTRESPITHWAASPAEALALALELSEQGARADEDRRWSS